MLSGRCLCGGVRYEIRGEPLAMYHCHCAQCRHANGSSFATNLLVRSAHFAVVAGSELLAKFESSPRKHRLFCSRCGSPVYSHAEASAQLVSVRCGTLDGDPGLRPSAHIHVASKAPWLEICDGIPQKPEGLAS